MWKAFLRHFEAFLGVAGLRHEPWPASLNTPLELCKIIPVLSNTPFGAGGLKIYCYATWFAA